MIQPGAKCFHPLFDYQPDQTLLRAPLSKTIFSWEQRARGHYTKRWQVKRGRRWKLCLRVWTVDVAAWRVEEVVVGRLSSRREVGVGVGVGDRLEVQEEQKYHQMQEEVEEEAVEEGRCRMQKEGEVGGEVEVGVVF